MVRYWGIPMSAAHREKGWGAAADEETDPELDLEAHMQQLAARLSCRRQNLEVIGKRRGGVG